VSVSTHGVAGNRGVSVLREGVQHALLGDQVVAREHAGPVGATRATYWALCAPLSSVQDALNISVSLDMPLAWGCSRR